MDPRFAAQELGNLGRQIRGNGGQIAFAGTDSRMSSAGESGAFSSGPVIATILQRNAAEQPPRAAAVRLDLRAQRIDIRKRALVAQPLHERQPQASIVEIAVEVEDVRLDDRGLDVAERRPQPDIRDRRLHDSRRSSPSSRRRRRRHQLVDGLQIRRGNAELASASGAAAHRPVDEVVMAEQRARLVDATL